MEYRIETDLDASGSSEALPIGPRELKQVVHILRGGRKYIKTRIPKETTDKLKHKKGITVDQIRRSMNAKVLFRLECEKDGLDWRTVEKQKKRRKTEKPKPIVLSI